MNMIPNRNTVNDEEELKLRKSAIKGALRTINVIIKMMNDIKTELRSSDENIQANGCLNTCVMAEFLYKEFHVRCEQIEKLSAENKEISSPYGH